MTQTTNQITQDNAEQLGNWWSLTETVQKAVAATVPDKDTWVLDITKDKHEDWVFSLPQFLTFNEALTNGTNKAIDFHYIFKADKGPVVGSKMKLTVSSKEIANATTTLLHWDCDPNWSQANWYVDTVSDIDCWLCPYLQVLFKHVPDKLWLKLEVTK